MRSATHAKEKLSCRHCFNSFASAAALTQHSEAQGTNCTVRKNDNFSIVTDEITAGVAATAGKFKDNTVRYVVNNTNTTDMKASHAAANKKQDESDATHWERNKPTW